jgi:hypothetical protein
MIKAYLELMNSFIKILFVLIITLYTYSSAQECGALLTIRSDIENVNYFIDDTLLGKGNELEINLLKGVHKIVAMEDNNRWDAKTFNDTIYVKDCNSISLHYTFNNKVLLNTVPQDAYVYSGDSLLGYTPLVVSNPSGNLRLEKPGFESLEISSDAFGKNEPFKMKFIGEPEEGQFYDTDLFKILTGSMIILGATTAYFKLKADNKFDDYQTTGDKKLLDQTHKFDLISGITFGALQINFAAIIYFFFVD